MEGSDNNNMKVISHHDYFVIKAHMIGEKVNAFMSLLWLAGSSKLFSLNSYFSFFFESKFVSPLVVP
jgi:hypothetical protein